METRIRGPLVVIVGPTASGKSDLAMKIAEEFNGEIICADSRTVYKGMDIATAKSSVEDQSRIRHHCLDLVNPDQEYNVSMFKEVATNAIDDITARNRLPILVGGTGLYVDAVIYDFNFAGPKNEKLRSELEALTIEQLVDRCIKSNIDLPVNLQNKRHLIRALEINGLRKDQKRLRENTIVVGISMDRESLKQRVSARVNKMFSDGVVQETKSLADQYGWEHESMKGIAYRVLRGHIEGQLNAEEAKQALISGDMKLAKRQITWLKRNTDIIWGDPNQLFSVVKKFIHSFKSQ